MEAQMEGHVDMGESPLFNMIVHKTTWLEVYYLCTNPRCKATDTDRIRANDAQGPAPMINCWKCGNGKGLTMEQSIMQVKGMKLIPGPVTN